MVDADGRAAYQAALAAAANKPAPTLDQIFTQNSPASEPAIVNFKSVRSSWWWLGSVELRTEFEGDAFAQAYEMMRRIPKIREEIFFHNQNGKTWRQLELANRQSFTMTYKKWIERLGWHKSITVGPRGISFDCSRSNHFLIEALRKELLRPTPFLMGNPFSRHGKSSKRALGIACFDEKSVSREAYTQRLKDTSWTRASKGFPALGLYLPTAGVYIPLPCFLMHGIDDVRLLPVREIMAYFRSFIQDYPPKDFVAYRRKFLNAKKDPRAPHPSTITFGLMAHDFSTVSNQKVDLIRLARYLIRTTAARTATPEDGKKTLDRNVAQLHKDLLNSRRSIIRVIRGVSDLV